MVVVDAKRVQDELTSRDWSQARLADECGVNQRTVENWLAGKAINHRGQAALCRALPEIDRDDLLHIVVDDEPAEVATP